MKKYLAVLWSVVFVLYAADLVVKLVQGPEWSWLFGLNIAATVAALGCAVLNYTAYKQEKNKK